MPGQEAALNLGPFPILQLAAAILVLVGIGMAVYRGLRDKGKAHEQDDPASRWYFDGPLKAHLERQEEIAQNTKAMRDVAERAEREKYGEELRKQTDLLKRIAIALERKR